MIAGHRERRDRGRGEVGVATMQRERLARPLSRVVVAVVGDTCQGHEPIRDVVALGVGRARACVLFGETEVVA